MNPEPVIKAHLARESARQRRKRVRYIQRQISGIVHQLKAPITQKPEVERHALVEELVGWMQEVRQLERVPV